MDKDVKTWTKDEFLAYVLIYAANCDFIETDEEKKYILNLVPQEQYSEMHLEIDYDNDFQTAQKIIVHINEKKYSNEELSKIVQDIEGLLHADDDFDSIEQMMLVEIKKLFQLH